MTIGAAKMHIFRMSVVGVTMAAMMNWINVNLDKHIVTIEDPIEYTFPDEKSLFQQREIGLDVPNPGISVFQA